MDVPTLFPELAIDHSFTSVLRPRWNPASNELLFQMDSTSSIYI